MFQASPNPAFDHQMMRRALAFARQGEGFVEPNPMVGCVICQGERIIGEGYHHRFGGPHAEIEALNCCTESARGGTAYVTLEPCAHVGKTPPCVDALLEAGLKRVVAAVRDPNRLVNGAGFSRLREAGVEVQEGVEADAAMELLAPFATLMREHRPYVIAKWAQTADGRLATQPEEDRWISCAESRAWVHRLRARVDGVLVGVNTVLRDDPLLTAREVPVARRCTRIVLDRQLRIALASKLVRTAREHPTIVFTSPQAVSEELVSPLRDRGVEVLPVAPGKDGVEIQAVLRALGTRGMTNLLVEGGPTVLGSFFRANFVDEAVVFIAPPAGPKGAETEWTYQPPPFEAHCQPFQEWQWASGVDICLRRWFTDPQRLWRR